MGDQLRDLELEGGTRAAMTDRSQEAEVFPQDEGPLFAVVEAWQQKPEARSYINALLKRNKRRSFGRYNF